MKYRKYFTYEVRWENGEMRSEHIKWSDAMDFFNHLVKKGYKGVNLIQLQIIRSNVT